jgi:hypothetical protein
MLRASLAFLTLALASCAGVTAEVTAVRAPEFAGRTFGPICVSAPDPDLAIRQNSEAAMASALRGVGATAIELGTVLFPGKEHSEDVIAAAVRQTGATGFLVLKPIASWTEDQWIPPTITTTSFMGPGGRRPWAWGYGTTWVSGGYSVTRPRANIEARLFDVATEETAWLASIGVTAPAGSSWVDVWRAAGEAAVARLIADGLVPSSVAR